MTIYLKHFTNVRETIRGGVLLLSKKYLLLRTFSWEFFRIFQSSFFLTVSGDCFRRTKNLPKTAVVLFKIAVLKCLRKLPGSYPLWSALLAKILKSTPPRIFSLEFFRIFQNSFSNIFERLHPSHQQKTITQLSQTIPVKAAVRGGVLFS